MSEIDFSVLLGETLMRCLCKREPDKPHYMLFECKSGKTYRLMHLQDCCETVEIIDLCGDLGDIVGSPILLAECVTQCRYLHNEKDEYHENPDCPPPAEQVGRDDSWTWTFYKLATMKGRVTVRWCWVSNGCYGEEVTFQEVPR